MQEPLFTQYKNKSRFIINDCYILFFSNTEMQAKQNYQCYQYCLFDISVPQKVKNLSKA